MPLLQRLSSPRCAHLVVSDPATPPGDTQPPEGSLSAEAHPARLPRDHRRGRGVRVHALPPRAGCPCGLADQRHAVLSAQLLHARHASRGLPVPALRLLQPQARHLGRGHAQARVRQLRPAGGDRDRVRAAEHRRGSVPRNRARVRLKRRRSAQAARPALAAGSPGKPAVLQAAHGRHAPLRHRQPARLDRSLPAARPGRAHHPAAPRAADPRAQPVRDRTRSSPGG